MKLHKITDIASGAVADDAGVNRFAVAMKLKLEQKRQQGKSGWNRTPATGWGCTIKELETMLRQHLAKGDVVDVANLCMMIWNRRNRMDDYKQYRRSQIAELADWHEGFDMTGVSISEPDKQAGSPKHGDKIARNPKNHADRWLVAAEYFAANFEPVP